MVCVAFVAAVASSSLSLRVTSEITIFTARMISVCFYSSSCALFLFGKLWHAALNGVRRDSGKHIHCKRAAGGIISDTLHANYRETWIAIKPNTHTYTYNCEKICECHWHHLPLMGMENIKLWEQWMQSSLLRLVYLCLLRLINLQRRCLRSTRKSTTLIKRMWCVKFCEKINCSVPMVLRLHGDFPIECVRLENVNTYEGKHIADFQLRNLVFVYQLKRTGPLANSWQSYWPQPTKPNVPIFTLVSFQLARVSEVLHIGNYWTIFMHWFIARLRIAHGNLIFFPPSKVICSLKRSIIPMLVQLQLCWIFGTMTANVILSLFVSGHCQLFLMLMLGFEAV